MLYLDMAKSAKKRLQRAVKNFKQKYSALIYVDKGVRRISIIEKEA